MTDPHARVADLLDRAAGDEVTSPPVDELIRRGTAQRRRNVWLTAAATVVVIGGFVGGGLAIQDADEDVPQPDSSQSPTPAPTATDADETPTAQQLADGRWQPVAPPPIDTLCQGSTLSTWGDNRLLVLSPMCRGLYTGLHAALYDPRRDLWTQLPDTPGGGEWVGTVGDSYVVVSPANGEAYRIPVPSVSTAAEVTWSKLPDLPERSDDYFGGNVTMLGERIVVAGTGVDRTGVWQLSDGAWQALPRLPLSSIPTSPAPSQQDPPEQPRILHTAVATVDGALYAFVAVSFAEPTRAGVDLESHVLRLTGNEWVERPLPSGLPAIVQHAEGVSSTLFLTGTNCPPYGSCPFNITPPMGLFDPVTDEYTDRSKPGFLDIARIGDAIVGYDAFTRSPGDNSVKPGDTAALDTYSKQWLDAPASEPLRNFAAAVGTPYGFIVLDAQAGGFILRPAE